MTDRKRMIYWHGKPIRNVDERNAAIEWCRSEIAKTEESDRTADDVFTCYRNMHERERLRENIRALENCRFINPNEGMLL